MDKCQYCGNRVKDKKNKFCSKECYHRSRIVSIKKKCKNCNKEFTVLPNKNNIFCSKKCRHDFLYKTVECEICGKEFESKKSHKSKFCSKQCYHESRKDRIIKICSVCGKEFQVVKSRKSTAEYCSVECRSISTEWIKNNRISQINSLKNKAGGQFYPGWNPKACDYFEEFDLENNTQGQHARNGGEFHIKELGYWVDYINHDLKLIMEYDEIYHQNRVEKDMRRQQEIQELYPEYRFKRIQEVI